MNQLNAVDSAYFSSSVKALFEKFFTRNVKDMEITTERLNDEENVNSKVARHSMEENWAIKP